MNKEIEMKMFGMTVEQIDELCNKNEGRLNMVVMSILSDAQDNMTIMNDWEASRKMINVVKYIVDEKMGGR